MHCGFACQHTSELCFNLSNVTKNLGFDRSFDSEGCKLTAGAAFVPQDSFQSRSKHKSHILQQSLWTEKELELHAVTARGGAACTESL